MKAEACTFDPVLITPKCRTSRPLRCKLRQTCKPPCNDAALSKHAASRWSCPWSKYSSAISPLQTVHGLNKTPEWRFRLVGRSWQFRLPSHAWSCQLYFVENFRVRYNFTCKWHKQEVSKTMIYCAYVNACMYVCMHACMHVCMYVCRWVGR